MSAETLPVKSLTDRSARQLPQAQSVLQFLYAAYMYSRIHSLSMLRALYICSELKKCSKVKAVQKALIWRFFGCVFMQVTNVGHTNTN